jgi:hypothetical protein
MSTYKPDIVSRVMILEETVQKLSKRIAAGAQRWDDTTGLSIDASILAICGLLWGFTSLLHETSNPVEARKLTKVCIRQLKKANLHAETMDQLKSTMTSICEDFVKQLK